MLATGGRQRRPQGASWGNVQLMGGCRDRDDATDHDDAPVRASGLVRRGLAGGDRAKFGDCRHVARSRAATLCSILARGRQLSRLHSGLFIKYKNISRLAAPRLSAHGIEKLMPVSEFQCIHGPVASILSPRCWHSCVSFVPCLLLVAVSTRLPPSPGPSYLALLPCWPCLLPLPSL